MRSNDFDCAMQGVPISRGIAIGRPLFLCQEEMTPKHVVHHCLSQHEIDHEVSRYQCAVRSACDEIRDLQNALNAESIHDAAVILDVHLQMMQDPLLTTYVEEEIRRTKKNVDHVFSGVIEEYQQKFNSLEDPFFRERFKDVQDVSRRLISHLREPNLNCKEKRCIPRGISNVPPNTIIFALDLTAFDIAEASSKQVLAFVTKEGGGTSHAAIIAKAKGIPYVSNIDVEKLLSSNVSTVIVDGRTGEVIFNPSEQILEKYQQMKIQFQAHSQKIDEVRKLKAETYDGYPIKLLANIEALDESENLHECGAAGVGLLRTELAFLASKELPTEDEQFAVYHQFVVNMKGLPIVFRIFDWSEDKPLLENLKGNHSCGCRTMRFLLREKEILKTQLRAILRASAYGNISILFPMISSLVELQEAKALFKEAKEELLAIGDPMADYIPIGCMIEVPSAVMIVDLLAKECDFLSIGTNDLVQYSLVMDRTENILSDLSSILHPSIIRLIKLIVSEANEQGCSVSICGEMASDARLVPLLLGLGVNELSVAPRYLASVKNAIRKTSIVMASKLVEHILSLESAEKIADLINSEYRLTVPEDCLL